MKTMRGSTITILMYHSVNPTPDMYSVSPDAFTRQIELIANSYPIVRLHEIRRHLDANERRVIVTFDDAFCDFADIACPILRRYSVPATVFVPTGFLGRANTWDAHLSYVTPKRIMTAERLRALAADDLVDIGSHTVDHLSMRSLALDDMRRQARESRRCLQELLQRPITMFSYPYGQRENFSARSEQVLSDAGYELAVTTCWGTRHSPSQLLKLRRISLLEKDDSATIRAKIAGRYDWIGLKELAGFTVRAALGRH